MCEKDLSKSNDSTWCLATLAEKKYKHLDILFDKRIEIKNNENKK